MNLRENLEGVGVKLEETTYRRGRTLAFDPPSEHFVGEGADQANPMLTRAYREPFVVPQQV
jgi:hypothetical protein